MSKSIKRNVKCECCNFEAYAVYEKDFCLNGKTGEYEWMWSCNNCFRTSPIRVTSPRATRIKGYQTPSQKNAIASVRAYLESNLNPNEKYGDEITRFEITVNNSDGQIWIAVQTEMMGLPENNLLRAIDHKFWNFLIGRRGGISAITYPQSFDQFKGGKAFGFNFK